MGAARRGTGPSPAGPSPGAHQRAPQLEVQLASTAAGIASRVVLHPIDSVKTRVQNLRGRAGTVNSAAVIGRLLRREGAAGLYRGIFGALAGVVPYSMLYMPSYEITSRALRGLGGARHVVAGCAAGLCGSIAKVPMDVVKKRLQAGLYPDFLTAVRAIAGEGSGGLSSARRFYAGWRSAVLYDVPYNAVQFAVLDGVRRAYRRRRGAALRAVDHVLVGALTGCVTSLLTEPLDVVKTRMMTQRARAGAGVYRGWWDCVSRIAREEGVPALWKGTLPRLVWVAASSAVWYGTYQTARQALQTRREAKTLRPLRPLSPD